MLLEFLLRLRRDGNVGPEYDGARRRRALIDGKDVRRHAVSSRKLDLFAVLLRQTKLIGTRASI